MTPCSHFEIYQFFWENCCLFPQGRRVTVLCWWWMQQIPNFRHGAGEVRSC